MIQRFGTIFGACAAAMVAVGAFAPAHSAETTISGAGCFPIGSPPSRLFEALVKEVNDRGKGVIQIDLKGGAPAIGSPFTLTQKTAKGAYDLVGCTEAYFGNVIPEAPVFRFSEYPYAELRKNGGLAYMSKLLAAKGLHYIARHDDNGPFHLWLAQPIDKPDLTGLHLRVAPVYTAFFKSLGATVQRSNIAQVYTYMENGTVQGFGWPAVSWVRAWIKVTKYRVDPGFYNATLHTLANLRAWNKLGQAQRDLLTKIGLEFEARAETSNPEWKAKQASELKWMADNGLKTITFKGADREKWVTAARKAGWDEVLERSPEHGPKLMKLFTKGSS